MSKKLKVDTSKQHIDRLVLLLTIGLCIFGTVMVFSASFYQALNESGTPYSYLIRQLMWLGLGAIAMILFAVTDYHFWVRFWPIIYLVGLVLLIAVKIPGIGVTVNGATRWIRFGPITLMPGEWAKIGLIFFITGYYTRFQKNIDLNKFIPTYGPAAIAGSVYAGLIMLQPNMSTAATVVFIAAGMLVALGANMKQFALCAAAAAAGAVLLIYTSEYRRARYMSFLDPFADAQGDGFQVVQGLLALGSGGVFGKGIGKSVQKNLYLPEPQNDFITAIIGEEIGFVGLIVMIIAFAILLYRCTRIAMNAEDLTGLLLASGITTMIGVQVLINIAVVTSSMPPTGVILPFVSYGGNALLICMSLMGMVLNVSKHQKR